jgi:hypothetical protein
VDPDILDQRTRARVADAMRHQDDILRAFAKAQTRVDLGGVEAIARAQGQAAAAAAAAVTAPSMAAMAANFTNYSNSLRDLIDSIGVESPITAALNAAQASLDAQRISANLIPSLRDLSVQMGQLATMPQVADFAMRASRAFDALEEAAEQPTDTIDATLVLQALVVMVITFALVFTWLSVGPSGQATAHQALDEVIERLRWLIDHQGYLLPLDRDDNDEA